MFDLDRIQNLENIADGKGSNWLNQPAFVCGLYRLSILNFKREENMLNLIWTGVVVLFFLWALGFSIHVGGAFIHLLLVLALIGLAYNLIMGRRVL